MKKKRDRNIPNYYGFRIYFFSTLLYFFLVMPIVGVLFLKNAPEWFPNSDAIQIENDSTVADASNRAVISPPILIKDDFTLNSTFNDLDFALQPENIDNKIDSLLDRQVSRAEPVIVDNQASGIQNSNKFLEILTLLSKLLLLSFLAGFAYNLPFKIFFKKKRKGKIIEDKLFQYCKKFLIKSPTINSLILLIPYSISIVYTFYMILFEKNIDEITMRFYIQYFFISLIATILTILFVYYWQKHRVHIKYIEYIFTGDELRKRIFKIKIGRIRNRLWVSSGMTTLLPLIIVVFYIFISITSMADIGITDYSEDHVKILYGKYLNLFSGISLEDFQKLGWGYVNFFDSTLMLVGIFTGIFTSFIYIFLFIRWTTEGIVGPVKELLANMQLTGQGELNQFSIVRTNDEIGELTEGFNDMSQRLKDYFNNISRINRANSRFVPRQFIEFLGKDNIADVQLGDQVQKEMTILFSDIRNFTTISEEMTPKENFDFLNNYLGYMEPVIRNNNGFIDKFMGDSIMAIFSESAEDALNAAIEMRIKLQEFNQVMGQFGKAPIDSGIGIHTGMLMLGIVGGEGRMDGTVISDAVNLASRIEGLTKLYGGSIIISEDTLIKLNDPSNYNFRFVDIVKVKGKREAVYVFEVIDGEPLLVKELKTQTKESFAKAIQYYKNQDLKSALGLFKKVHKINKLDKATELYISRCERFIKDGIPKDWDGIEVITEK